MLCIRYISDDTVENAAHLVMCLAATEKTSGKLESKARPWSRHRTARASRLPVLTASGNDLFTASLLDKDILRELAREYSGRVSPLVNSRLRHEQVNLLICMSIDGSAGSILTMLDHCIALHAAVLLVMCEPPLEILHAIRHQRSLHDSVQCLSKDQRWIVGIAGAQVAYWRRRAPQEQRAECLLTASLIHLDLISDCAGQGGLDLLEKLKTLALITNLTALRPSNKKV